MGLQLQAGGIPHPRLNSDERPIANKYREGKMKSTLERESKVREIVKREATAAARGCGRAGDTERDDRQPRAVAACDRPGAPRLHRPRLLTRLETRTKESSGRASVRVASPCAQRKQRGSVPSGPRGRQSARAGTRKMVNYAWAGRSQGKRWWRPVAVLTCKSIVKPGYRGERLIEPSSSWFPPKFPSG